jgi:hypothetical protein
MHFMQRESEMKLLLSAGLFAAAATSAFADAILGTPNEVIIGINDAGHLNIPYRTSRSLPHLPMTDATRLGRIGLRNWDATLTGVETTRRGSLPTEGWGVGASIPSEGFLGIDLCSAAGDRGLQFIEDVSTLRNEPRFFSSAVTCGAAKLLKVTHVFTRSTSKNLIRVDVTIENQSCDEINDVLYRRVADWDVDPYPFAEYVTITGTEGSSDGIYAGSNNNGFCSPIPFLQCNTISDSASNDDFEDEGPFDHGMHVQLNLGSLSPASKVTFSTWYGVAKSECAALYAVTSVGADLWSFGQSKKDGTPATFIYAVQDHADKMTMPGQCLGNFAPALELAASSAINDSEAID